MIRLLLVLIVFMGTPALAQNPPDLAGVWQTGARAGSWGYVSFSRCGPAYCGVLVGGGGRKVDPQYFGTIMVRNMRRRGDGFSGGRILDVETGRWYIATMRFLDSDRLKVNGCVLGGVICLGQTWRRVR